jgi:hypothetical protein
VRRNASLSIVLVTMAVLGGCTQRFPPLSPPRDQPPALSAHAIPHTKTQLTVVHAQEVLTGTADSASLESLLEQSGFILGQERTFVSRTSALDRADTRVLGFRSADGAAQYLGWVSSHPGDVIGDAKPGSALQLPVAPRVFVHTPNGCCAKDVPKSLAVWQRDRYVLLVIANGGMAKQKTLTDLASQLDGLV